MRAIILSHAYIDPEQRGKLRALAGLGCTLSVAVPDRWEVRRQDRELVATWGDDAGVRIVPIPVRGASGPHDSGRWRRGPLKRLLTDFRPDILQIEEEPWTRAAALASGLAARLGITTTLFARESLARRLPLLAAWRRHRTLPRVAGLIGANRGAAAILGRLRPGVPATTMPQTGITPPLELPRNEHDGLAIGFVGRLVPEKGLDLLFRACIKLLGRWSLTVVGSGPAQEELEALAERLGIAARINWLGALPAAELGRLWGDLDCLVVPSRTTPRWVETYHAPLVEAMGHGVTVVGSDSGALPELIDTAGLVVPEDDVPALTAALQHLADSPRERQRLSREGRQRVMSEYTHVAVAQRTWGFWEQLLAGRAGARKRG
jgi:glycosyltransferase involved in cell wall biosynthesis